jgi:quinol monooxygenase YgiN
MSEPVVFISHFKIKPGKLESLKQLHAQVVARIEADKPGTVAFLHYLNEAGTEYTVVHVFPDAQALDRHTEGAGARSQAAFEFIEPTGREVYGTPSAEALAMLTPPEASGIAFRYEPQPIGGFLRLKAG